MSRNLIIVMNSINPEKILTQCNEGVCQTGTEAAMNKPGAEEQMISNVAFKARAIIRSSTKLRIWNRPVV